MEFTGDADFSGATFEEKPIFERALGDKTYKARFSYKADPEDYNFKVSHNSRYKIETEEQEHNGTKFTIDFYVNLLANLCEISDLVHLTTFLNK